MIVLQQLELPNSLVWLDEFEQPTVSQTHKRTLAGSIVIFSGSRPNGIPVTITSGPDYGWVKRSIVLQIKSLADQAGLVMTLDIKGKSFNVVFDHSNNNAFTAIPIYPYANPTDTDYYKVKLQLVTV